MFWNKAPRSKLLGITELKPWEMPEIFGVLPHPQRARGRFLTVFDQAESDGVEESPWPSRHTCLIVDWEGYDGTRPPPKHAGLTHLVTILLHGDYPS